MELLTNSAIKKNIDFPFRFRITQAQRIYLWRDQEACWKIPNFFLNRYCCTSFKFNALFLITDFWLTPKFYFFLKSECLNPCVTIFRQSRAALWFTDQCARKSFFLNTTVVLFHKKKNQMTWTNYKKGGF